MKNRNKKYNPRKLEIMRTQGKVSRNAPSMTLTPEQVALKVRAITIINRNSFPEIRDHREGCEFAGWMEISIAARPPEWRVSRMKFFGDWCGEENLSKILPDPFLHPNAYWHLTHNDWRLTERQKRQMLKAVSLDYDKEPRKTKQEMELSA